MLSSCSCSNVPRASIPRNASRAAIRAGRPLRQRLNVANRDTSSLTSISFDVTSEVAPELAAIPPHSQAVDVGLLPNKQSLCRQNLDPTSEEALCSQVSVEFTNSYFYTALAAYFARDSVGLMGFAKKYRAESEEERKHALEVLDYVNMRGGTVQLSALMAPPSDLAENDQLGDALAGAEFALALERLTNEKLLALHKVAEECGDPNMTDFVEGMLEEQAEALYEAGLFVTRVRRAGLGLGVTAIDQELLNED
uniref:Ferritin n=1 Tax=Pycnococcus provasolii TaxID=41880 RepID=A0A7S2AFY3_9CHLO